MTATMAAVARTHASSVSCPVIMREFYLLPEEKRVLFENVDAETAPVDAMGEKLIREELVNLHAKLLGVDVDTESEEVDSAYELFHDVWTNKRATGEGGRFEQCDMFSDADMFYFSGIMEDGAWLADDRSSYDWDAVYEYYASINWSDELYVARTWVVVLAYLMTDYHYLHL